MPDLPAQDPHEFIAALDEVDLARFCVTGTYVRYDEAVRNALQDARQAMLEGLESTGRRRENHLIWAAPGTGKTYFVQQVAASVPGAVRYQELNLAKCGEPEFRSGLAALDGTGRCLCLVDEVDARPQEPWPYEALLPYLDAAVERGATFVFVLAGSSGANLPEMKDRIAARPKGTDLLSRIPTGHEYEIGPMSLGDRVLIVLGQLRQAGRETGRQIRAVEKLGLYYVALNPRLTNARQLREFAVRAVERVPKHDGRVKYDHLFAPGDPANKAFWLQALPVAERMANTFVILSDSTVTGSAPAAAGTRARTNLPRDLTTFIGRNREIAQVKRLLPATGLLTLTGSGGCGKTRLALRVAADLVDQYADGVWLAELAALSDADLVPKAVATALDVPEQPGRAMPETLKDYLRPKSMLLVLDSCEHLISACAHLTDALLRTSPALRILGTSREPLGVPGEVVFRVPSLSVPRSASRPSVEQLMSYEAAQLFAERAALSQPGFRVTSASAAAVALVTQRLDGIPLAIELAAARVKALPVDAIAERLDDRFRLLTGGSRTALPRHQTLRATLEWSYDLLSEPERTLLRRLTVFAGGCTLAAAEQVCAGASVDRGDVLDLLTHLVDKSLVVFDEHGEERRYRLLESVRQYGRDRLQESDEAGDVRRRHRDWCIEFANLADPKTRGPEQIVWLDRLEAEHDNLRAALAWSLAEPDGATAALRLAGALSWFWYLRGHWNEGRDWIEKALARGEEAPPDAVVKAIVGDSFLARLQGDYARLMPLVEKGMALSRQLEDKSATAWFLWHYGFAALNDGDNRRAREFLDDALMLCRQLGDKWLIAASLNHAGHAARARADYAQAAMLYEESLALFREIEDGSATALLLRYAGAVSLVQEQIERAESCYAEALVACRSLREPRGVMESIEGLAQVASVRGHYDRAARLFGAAEASSDVLGRQRMPIDRGLRDTYVALTRAKLGDAAFEAGWAEGRAMTLEQAAGLALRVGTGH